MGDISQILRSEKSFRSETGSAHAMGEVPGQLLVRRVTGKVRSSTLKRSS
jgi:hypothetical protein